MENSLSRQFQTAVMAYFPMARLDDESGIIKAKWELKPIYQEYVTPTKQYSLLVDAGICHSLCSVFPMRVPSGFDIEFNTETGETYVSSFVTGYPDWPKVHLKDIMELVKFLSLIFYSDVYSAVRDYKKFPEKILTTGNIEMAETTENNCCELFDTYLAAKKVLNTRIKQVLEIMAKYNALNVNPPEAAQAVAKETTQVSSHQWRYNSGHETIYCEHRYGPRSHGGLFQMCMVKVPVKYLSMKDEEIIKDNRDAAIAALEAKKADIEAQIEEKTRSMRNYLKRINSEIDDLKK